MSVVYFFMVLLFIYIAVCTVYIFAAAFAGRVGKLKKYTSHPVKASIAVVIPSYKEDNVIIHTAKSALSHQYGGRFTVTVAADQLKPESIAEMRAAGVNVIEVKWDKSMKAKSLNAAFAQLDREGGYDIAVILDADNIMSPGCLEKINDAYQQGWKAIQCHRTAKNKNTPVAVLDALSEEVNNTIFRRGQRVMKFSCSLIGSGMAFEFAVIRDIFALPQIQNNPGEDREIDVQLVKRRLYVEYLEDAYVYDEKVQRKEVYEKQRTRWIGTQVDHIRQFLSKDMKESRFTSLHFVKLFQSLILPRLLLMLMYLLIIAVCAAEWIFKVRILRPDSIWWLSVVGLYVLSIIVATPSSFYNAGTVRALMHVPVLMLAMVKAIFKIGQNKKEFIHTPKEFSS